MTVLTSKASKQMSIDVLRTVSTSKDSWQTPDAYSMTVLTSKGSLQMSIADLMTGSTSKAS